MLGPLSLSLWSRSLSSPCDLCPTRWPKTQSRSFQAFSKLKHNITSQPNTGQSGHRASPNSRGEINFTSVWKEWQSLQPSSTHHQKNGYLEAISSFCRMSLQEKPSNRMRGPWLYKTHKKKHWPLCLESKGSQSKTNDNLTGILMPALHKALVKF